MSDEHFESWGIVDLFGHTRTAGRISEQTIGGETFIRVDVPNEDDTFHTDLYGKGAIYKMSLTDEPIARAVAKRVAPRPVSRYEVGNLLEDQRVKEERDMFSRQPDPDDFEDDDIPI